MAAKKPTAQLKLEGTYREDRHGKRADYLISDISAVTEIDPPKSLKDKYVISHFKYHTEFLMSLKILKLNDLPEIELMYNLLQQIRIIQKKLNSTKDILEDFALYDKMMNRYQKLVRDFSTLANKYYISPQARTRLTTEHLQMEKLQKENVSIASRLIKSKKA